MYIVRPIYALSRFIKLTLYSGHLIIAANETWPIGDRIIEVPLYKQSEEVVAEHGICSRTKLVKLYTI